MIFSLFVAALGALWASLALAVPAAARPQHGRPALDLRPRPRWARPGTFSVPLQSRQDVDARASAKAAIDAMNTKFYSEADAIWSPSDPWWLSGVALTGVIDYMRKTNTADYLDQVKTIIDEQRKAWPAGGGEFRADSTDDTGWWALAMVRMYDLTGDRAFLDISVEDEAYMYKYWTSSPCGGGMYVDIKAKTYKNAIANQLYMKLAASLHNRIANDTLYLSRAKTAWSWLQESGMINSENLFNDGLAMDSDGTCFNNNLPVWTYNQGVILGALVELYLATNNTAHLSSAQTIADAVLSPTSPLLTTTLSTDGTSTLTVLTESGCVPDEPSGCNNDQQIFKGVFAYSLAELAAVLSSTGSSTKASSYQAFLKQNAQSARDTARGKGTDLYDVSWTGPFRNSTIAKQASAVGLSVACI
ncbi:glycoside hydrolase [Staphylotrichum tortipilum]|uniref:Glycoside hydrolase n=1 Tax=Staphylotrichum tortipilum TaxID=2831512 RepID=A0AAN6RS41_9PEZI|nr:glycoside hydrolase [Staphylotrichum longicolle]